MADTEAIITLEIDMFRKFLGKNKAQTGDIHAKKAMDALDQKDYHLAVKELTQAVKNGVASYDLAELHTILGRAYKNLAQYEKAIAAHQEALKIDPNCYRAWNNLGIVYFSLNQYEEAEECHQKALAIEPKYAFAIACLGALYIHRNQPQKAIDLSEKAILLIPGMGTAHSNLALAYAMVGRFAEAEKSLKQAILLGYTNWRTIQNRINNLKDMGGKNTVQAEWLPASCPTCGAPISASTVIWTSDNTADCSYCRTNIKREPG